MAEAAAITDNPRAVIGDNAGQPSIETYVALNEILPAHIEITEAKLFSRLQVLTESYGRMPAAIDNDEQDAKLTDFDKKQFGELKGALDSAHKRYKQPFLDGGRTVDALFKRSVDKIDAMQKAIRKIQTDYKLRKEEEARKAAREAARKAAEEEERRRKEAEALAAAAKTEADLDEAIAEESQANIAAGMAAAADARAEAKPADLTRSRGDYGGVSSLRSEWKIEVTNRDELIKNPAIWPFIPADALDTAARAWLKANAPKDFDSPAPVITGCRAWIHRFTR